MEQRVDVIIAGAGLSGLLSLLHLSRLHPDWTFCLVEREPAVGGRLRSTLRTEGAWSCGLQGLSSKLYDHIASLVGGLSEELRNAFAPMQTLGILAGQKLVNLPATSIVSAEMAKALGGTAAAKDWPEVERLLFQESNKEKTDDASWSQAWKGDKKSGALILLEHLAHFWGMPELGPAPLESLQEKARLYRAGLWTGPWERIFDEMLGVLRAQDRLRLETRAQIMTARYEEDTWTVASTRGIFQSARLVVAQSPWEAILWLPKDLWPTKLLNLTSKAKPASLVILSDVLRKAPAELPDALFVLSEEVQVIRGPESLCFQACLPYELTVQAPAVVKAVKRLKRAKKKLQTALPELELEGDHIALLPVGWAQATTPQEQRWFDKIDMTHISKKHLSFVGESYGSEVETEQNLIHSVAALAETWDAKGE